MGSAHHEQALSRLAPGLPATIILGRAREVIAAADAVLTVSGTAALECLLAHRPMVVTYRMAAVSYLVARLLVHVPYFFPAKPARRTAAGARVLTGRGAGRAPGTRALALAQRRRGGHAAGKRSWPRSSARSAATPAAPPRTRCSACSGAEWVTAAYRAGIARERIGCEPCIRADFFAGIPPAVLKAALHSTSRAARTECTDLITCLANRSVMTSRRRWPVPTLPDFQHHTRNDGRACPPSKAASHPLPWRPRAPCQAASRDHSILTAPSRPYPCAWHSWAWGSPGRKVCAAIYHAAHLNQTAAARLSRAPANPTKTLAPACCTLFRRVSIASEPASQSQSYIRLRSRSIQGVADRAPEPMRSRAPSARTHSASAV